MKQSRRQFLHTTTAATVAGLTGTSASTRWPEQIRVGIIGIEGHVSEITNAAKQMPSLRITAVAETKPAQVKKVKTEAAYANARLYDDYRKLLDAEKLDVIAICGENGGRAEILMDCAERKIPIASEKPLTISLQELTAVKKAIKQNNVPLTMLLPMRFAPQYQAMKQIVDSGQIGDVVTIATQKSYKLGTRPDWMKSQATYGGTIPYIGIHMVDLMRYVTGREFVTTAAFQSNVGFPEIGTMENNTVLIFQLDNRGTASLRMDYLRPATAPTHGDDRLRIAGTKGVVEFQEGGSVTLITSTQKPMTVTELPAEKLLFVDFLESLYDGKPHLIKLEEIFRVTEIVLKSRTAAETGRLIKL